MPPSHAATTTPRATEVARERPVPHRSPVARRVAISAVLLAGLLAIIALDPLYDALTAAVAVAEPVFSTRPVAGAALFVALSALSAVLAFVSSGALVPVALEVWGPFRTAALLWVGWTLGGSLAYALGRFVGRPAVRRLDRKGNLERTLGRVRPDTPLWLVALIQLGLQSELAGVLLGTARYPFLRYAAALAVVEVAFAALAVAVGMGLTDRHPTLLAGAGVLFVVLGVSALVVVQRRLPPASH